jgi:cell division protein FtsN
MAAASHSFLKGFLAGLATGLLLSLIVAFGIGRNNPFVDLPVAAYAPGDGPIVPKEAPSYDYYKALPEQPQPVISPAPASPYAKPAAAYHLQAGAFLNAEDAEEMKARLALLGFEASIVEVEDAEAIRLHKVRVGPFTGMDELNQARARLTKNNIDTLLIKPSPDNVSKETP